MGDRDQVFSGDMRDCWQCKKSLISDIRMIGDEVSHGRLLELMASLETCMSYPTIRKNNSWIYSISYLMGVAYLTKILVTKYMQLGKNLNDYLAKKQLSRGNFNQKNFSKRMTRLTLSERVIIAIYLSYLLESRYFPKRLTKALDNVDFRYQFLTKDGGFVPYWLHTYLISYKKPAFGINAHFY